jgi:hypothetical protein
MRHRLVLGLVIVATALAVSGSALAFDCIRVSGSVEGLKNSTTSGNWLYFDMTPGGGGLAELLGFFEVDVTAAQLACLQAAYSASDAPTYFALGIGVAGGGTEHGTGVLAHNAPDSVLMNGTGIDHLDDTVVPVLIAAAPGCGVPT